MTFSEIFGSKYKRITRIIKSIPLQSNISIAPSNYIGKQDGIELPVTFDGTFDSKNQIRHITSITIYPKYIINICNKHKLPITMFTTELMLAIQENIDNNIIPTYNIMGKINNRLLINFTKDSNNI